MNIKNIQHKLMTKSFGILFFATIALISSFWQTVAKIDGLKNPGAPLSCNINPVLDCGSVLDHWTASVLGVSNSLVGIAMFMFLATIGLLLVLKVRLTAPAKIAALAVSTIALLFVIWFFAMSLYVIGKICIFCIAIWAATIPLWALVVGKYAGDFDLKPSFLQKYVKYLDNHPERFIMVMYIAAILMYLFRFREYYF